MTTTETRQSTGVLELDELLGGGLRPGSLTVIMGATGIGKTQLGLQFAHAGLRQESRRGVLFDMSSRGDPQSHAAYAARMFDWQLNSVPADDRPDLTNFFDARRVLGDYLHVFDYRGQRINRRDLEWEAWQEWQGQLNARLQTAIGFLYGNFVRGVRRVVVDGIEPVDRPGESIQFNLFEYLYHQILRKDPEWVARDLFRERYLANAAAAKEHGYDPAAIGCVLLVTSHETLLDELISRPLAEGDVISNANTLILMGKVRDGLNIRRGLYVAKHRGSACADRIVPYEITAHGLRLVG